MPLLSDSTLAFDAGAGGSAGLVKLDEVAVGAGGSTTIAFSSISGAYESIFLEGLLRTDYASGPDYATLQVGNGSIDTGSNYNFDCSSFEADNLDIWNQVDLASTTEIWFCGTDLPYTGAIANAFAHVRIDLPNYADTNVFKTVHSLGAGIQSNTSNAAANSWFRGYGVWKSTNAIDEIQLAPGNGTNFVQYSNIRLWGITG